MKTKNNSPLKAILKFILLLPVIILVLVLFSTCAAKKKAGSVSTEIAPPPPPPPPSQPSAEEPFVVVEDMPVFPGGDSNILKYLAENTQYPETAKENNIQGRVIVRFCVTAKGTIDRVSVLRGVSPELDAEAMRVISTLPLFKPGRQGGKEVPVWYMAPVEFGLKNDSHQFQPPSKYEVDGNDTLYSFSQLLPQYPGGKDAIWKFKTDNLKYPLNIKSIGIEGTVYVGFVIEKNGSLSNIRIMMGVSPSLDAEAIRVTKAMPAWLPGKENGKPVKVISGMSYEFSQNPQNSMVSENGNFVRVVEEKDINQEEPFVVVEEMPMFPGGDSALLAYLANNTKYPDSAKANNVQGRVIIRFCVTKTGGVDRISVLKGVSQELDEEALRVTKTLPLFKPGKQNGKPVNVWYMVPVEFALEGKSADAGVKTSVTNPPASPKLKERSGYDEPPLFKGGEAAVNEFIKSNIVYPDAARKNKISGRVLVNFCVNTDGSLNPVLIYKGVDPELDNEAVRVISSMPAWKPGMLKGKPVRVWYTVPVTFPLK